MQWSPRNRGVDEDEEEDVDEDEDDAERPDESSTRGVANSTSVAGGVMANGDLSGEYGGGRCNSATTLIANGQHRRRSSDSRGQPVEGETQVKRSRHDEYIGQCLDIIINKKIFSTTLANIIYAYHEVDSQARISLHYNLRTLLVEWVCVRCIFSLISACVIYNTSNDLPYEYVMNDIRTKHGDQMLSMY